MTRPYPVDRFASAADFAIPQGAVLLHGTLEDRSVLPSSWANSGVERHEIFETDSLSSFSSDSPDAPAIILRRRDALRGYLAAFRGKELFLDFTGLSHHVWMPLLRAALDVSDAVRCIYSEPLAYRNIPNPRPSEFYDLSVRIQGISPIATFSRLSDPDTKSPLLVPLLGFEGTRFKYVVETLQPEGHDIVPVVGVPGFKTEFPFHSFRGNADALSANRAWEHVRFSDAACPFSLFDTLEAIQVDRPNRFLQISPIGTKPHALGAALFAIANADVELVYDHPVRKKQRTTGAGTCHVYYVTEFLRGRPNRTP